MSRAQSQVQLVLVVFGVVLAALVLLFGYRMIAGVGKQAEVARFEEFKAQLQHDITVISPKLGSFRRQVYDVPGSASELCFYAPSPDRGVIPDLSCQELAHFPLIDAAVNQTGSNAFLIGEGFEGFGVDGIETGVCPLRCFGVQSGKVSFRMTGTGEKAFISLS